jgi:phospholipid/cholesterol/gamma-HCH transport system substrate-binding protein
MQRSEIRQALIGGLVLLLVGLFFVHAYSGDREPAGLSDGYVVSAIFPRVDGLAKGAEVRLGGIRIGEVAAMSLTENMRARVDMRLDANSVKVPTDSSAVILSNGLAGAKYIELDPGGEEKMLADGGRITHTQGAIVVEELMDLIIGQIKAKQASQSAQ